MKDKEQSGLEKNRKKPFEIQEGIESRGCTCLL